MTFNHFYFPLVNVADSFLQVKYYPERNIYMRESKAAELKAGWETYNPDHFVVRSDLPHSMPMLVSKASAPNLHSSGE